MAMAGGKPENLTSQDQRTKDEQRLVAQLGGIKSGEVRREKRRMENIYAAVLAKTYKLTDEDGKIVEVTGEEMLTDVVSRIVQKGDSAAVSMIKELREGLDGTKNKNELTGPNGGPILTHGLTAEEAEEFKRRYAEIYPLTSKLKTDD